MQVDRVETEAVKKHINKSLDLDSLKEVRDYQNDTKVFVFGLFQLEFLGENVLGEIF